MKRSRIGPKTYEAALALRIAQDARRREKVSQKPHKSQIASGKPLERKQGLLQRRSKPMKRVSGAASLKNRAWREFSVFIRRRGTDERGYVKCVTCSVVKHWTVMHAGLFVSGRGNSILFDERGCWAQCFNCNVTFCGNLSAYEKVMQEKFGQKVVDELKSQRDKTVKWLPDELKSIEGHYRRINRSKK